jgi:hypothetical protein
MKCKRCKSELVYDKQIKMYHCSNDDCDIAMVLVGGEK